MNKLILYKNTKITPERNAKVDSIDLYLEEVPSITCIIQKLKTDLDLTVKVNLDQEEIDKAQYNYAEYIEGEFHYYYFILDMTWTAQSTVSLQLSMDTINTFWNQLMWDDKTLTIREHRDRFVENLANTNGFTAIRKIDYQNEGFSGLPMERISDVVLRDEEGLDTNWHLIYNTESGAETTSPIKAYLMPDKVVPVKGGAIEKFFTWKTKDFPMNTWLYFTVKDNGGGSDRFLKLRRPYHTEIVYNLMEQDKGQDWVIVLHRTEKTYTLGVIQYNSYNVPINTKTTTHNYDAADPEWPQFDLSNLNTYRSGGTEMIEGYDEINALPATSKTSGASISLFSKLDRTQSTLNSIILMPYLPVDASRSTDNYYYSSFLSVAPKDNLVYWKINDISNNDEYFNHKIHDGISTEELTYPVPDRQHRYKARRNWHYESKLYHSDFYQKKLTYDRDSLLIQLEKLQPTTKYYTLVPKTFDVYFKMSANISSAFMFKVDYNPELWANRIYTEDYPDVLISNRNNQEMIYSSDYLNYLRTGYNYDRQDKNWSLGSTWINTAASVGGSAIGAILGLHGGGGKGLTGLASASQIGGAVSQISNAIVSTAQANRNFDRKLTELRATTTNVSGVSDVDFMKEYCGNRLHVMTYDLISQVKWKVYDLFFYTGYGVEVQKIPNFEGRRYFNFVQCEPVFVNENENILSKYVADIKDRCAKGITIYHRYQSEYDWEQYYENWETWIN